MKKELIKVTRQNNTLSPSHSFCTFVLSFHSLTPTRDFFSLSFQDAFHPASSEMWLTPKDNKEQPGKSEMSPREKVVKKNISENGNLIWSELLIQLRFTWKGTRCGDCNNWLHCWKDRLIGQTEIRSEKGRSKGKKCPKPVQVTSTDQLFLTGAPFTNAAPGGVRNVTRVTSVAPEASDWITLKSSASRHAEWTFTPATAVFGGNSIAKLLFGQEICSLHLLRRAKGFQTSLPRARTTTSIARRHPAGEADLLKTRTWMASERSNFWSERLHRYYGQWQHSPNENTRSNTSLVARV